MNETPNSLPQQEQPAPQPLSAASPEVQPLEQTPPAAGQMPTGLPSEPKKSPVKKILLGVGIVVILAAIVGGIYLNIGQFFKGEVPAVASLQPQPVYQSPPYDIEIAPVTGQTTSTDPNQMVDLVQLPPTPASATDPTNTVTFNVSVNTREASSGAVNTNPAIRETQQLNAMTMQQVNAVEMRPDQNQLNAITMQQMNAVPAEQLNAMTMQQINQMHSAPETMQMVQMRPEFNNAVMMTQQSNFVAPMDVAPANNVQPATNSPSSATPMMQMDMAPQNIQNSTQDATPAAAPSSTSSLPLAFNGTVAHAQGLTTSDSLNLNTYFSIDSGSLPNNCSVVPHHGDVTADTNYICTVDASTLAAGSSQAVTFNLTATNTTAMITIQRQALPVAACTTSTLPTLPAAQQISLNRSDLANLQSNNDSKILSTPVQFNNSNQNYGNQYNYSFEVFTTDQSGNNQENAEMETGLTEAIRNKTFNYQISDPSGSGSVDFSITPQDLLTALTTSTNYPAGTTDAVDVMSALNSSATKSITIKILASCHPTTGGGMSSIFPTAFADVPPQVEIIDFTINFIDAPVQAACDVSTLPTTPDTQQVTIDRAQIANDDHTVDIGKGLSGQYSYRIEVDANGQLSSAMTDAVNAAMNSNTDMSIVHRIDEGGGLFHFEIKTKELMTIFMQDKNLAGDLQDISIKSLTIRIFASCPALLRVIPLQPETMQRLPQPIMEHLQPLTMQRVQLQPEQLQPLTMQRVQRQPAQLLKKASTSAFIPRAYAAANEVEIGNLTINITDTVVQPVCPTYPTFGDQKIQVDRGDWQNNSYPTQEYPLNGTMQSTPGYANVYTYVVTIDDQQNAQLSQLLSNSNQDLIGLQTAFNPYNSITGLSEQVQPAVNGPDLNQLFQLIQSDKTVFKSADQKAIIMKQIHAAKTFTIEVDATCTKINNDDAQAFIPYAHAAGAPIGTFEFDVTDPSPPPAPSPAPAPAPIVGGGGGIASPIVAPTPTPAPSPAPAAPSAPQCLNDNNQWVLYNQSQTYQSDYNKANQNFPGVLTADTLCPQNHFQRVYGALTVYRINTYLFNQIQSQNTNANIGFRVRRVTDLTTLKPFTDYQNIANLQQDILTNIYTDIKFNTLTGRIDPATFYDTNKSITLAPLDNFTLPELYSMFLQQLEMVMSYHANATVSFPIVDKFLPSYLAGYKQNPKLTWAAKAWTYAKMTGMCDPTGMSFGDFFQKPLDRATVSHCFATANPAVMSDLFLLSPDQVVQKYGQ